MESDGLSAPALQAMFAEFGVRRLQAAYGDAVSRRAWDEVATMFAPDCVVHLDLRDREVRTVTGGPALVEFVAGSIERFEFFEFTLLNAVVDVAPGGEEAEGRLYMCELRQDRDAGRWSTAYGLYRDRYRRHEGRWYFAERHYSSLARTHPDGDGMVVFSIPPG